MSARDLDAAGITDPLLRESYERCRVLNAQYGKTYYLATLLLPPAKRPYVHALYGFARYADEIVDDLSSTLTEQEKADELGRWGEAFLVDVKNGGSEDPIARAVVDTVLRWNIPLEHFEAFLHSMRMDLTVTEYQTYEDLYEYVYGSAAVIGLQMVPILEPTDDEAYERAKDLGIAFQLANFIRDVGEDLERGRVYLPLEELARFGVTRADLETRVVDERLRNALRFQIQRVRDLEAASKHGIDLLAPWSRPCIDAARILLRHRRRGGTHRLRGVRQAGHRADAPSPGRGRTCLGQGRTSPPRLIEPVTNCCQARTAEVRLSAHAELRVAPTTPTRSRSAPPARTRRADPRWAHRSAGHRR